MKNILIVVDLQKQFADEGKEKYNKCLAFIEDNGNNYDSITATCFLQLHNTVNYRKHLNWTGCRDTRIDDLEFFWWLPNPHNFIVKANYGTYSDDDIKNYFHAEKDDNIDIIGCDSDACVLALCFSLWDNGYTNFHILTDYIYTNAKDFDNDTVIKIMKRNFGDCVK